MLRYMKAKGHRFTEDWPEVKRLAIENARLQKALTLAWIIIFVLVAVIGVNLFVIFRDA